MLTTKDFISQYENCSDAELYGMYRSLPDYSEDAQQALKKVIEKRGGIKKLAERHEQELTIQNEKERIRHETSRLFVKESNLQFLKDLIQSNILSPEETQQLIETTYVQLKAEKEDQKIKPRTVFGSLIGGAIGSIVGGVIWGLQMIQMHRMFLVLVAGLALISYGLIRLFTKQSKANRAVVIATVLSVAGALIIGEILYENFG